MRRNFKISILMWALLALAVFGAIEGLSYIAYRINFGTPLLLRDSAYQESRQSQREIAPVPTFDEAVRGTEKQRKLRQAEVLHPYAGFVLNPDSIGGATEYGFPRGRQSSVDRRSSDEFVIGVFGGSVAAMFGGRGVKEFVRSLKQSPQFRDKKIVVTSYALGGYKQPQQLMVLNYVLALGGKLDAVINLEGYNDVSLHFMGNMKQNVFPAFPRAWSQRVSKLEEPHLRALSGGILYLRSWRDDLYSALSNSAARHLPTVNLFWRHVDLGLERSMAEKELAIRSFVPEDRGFVVTGPRVEFPDKDAIYRFLVDLWATSSMQMHNLCRANGIRYYHFLQPNQYLEGSKPMGPDERRIAIRKNSGPRHPVRVAYPMLIREGQELQQLGVPFFDLTQIFADVNEAAYMDNCCHLNPLGNTIQSQEIARIVSENWDRMGKEILPARQRSREETEELRTTKDAVAVVPSKPDGALYNLTPSQIIGWAWDQDNPKAIVEVEIYDGDRIIGRVRADRFQESLLKSKKGDGKHGFRLTVTSSLWDGKPHTIHAKIAGTDWELKKSPQTITFGSSSP